ncbi:hypothetical protein BASA50_006481 [Batrachochytrium salamandrivorans]|uniref:Uncharacterized protein n=1 Tax=Batrachochytrium salamandrivorans TaxID=1357716 RepID=A0ABQ8FAU6_9FUNG|nr:hypothetical protein BASA62_003700 [Batrachochytrium salamandrivorans]KAH6578579.1 hypothetical protein BASA60_003579 [Batrachochytrium salamandrivorans]KAH6594531.1 hypothetical protein BASA50_006481 [Batrachochytrium salamandrivorans]
MKFSVLVVAAMAITLVSASGRGQPKGFLKKGGGMIGSESLEKLVRDDDPESEPPQNSPRRGARQGPSQSSLAHGSIPVLTLDEVLHNSDTPQVPELRKKDPICDSIVRELQASRDKICDLDYRFQKKESDFYKLMTGKGNRWMETMSMSKNRYEKDRKHDLDPEKIREWLGSNPGAITKLQEIKEESIDLEGGHRVIWGKLLGKNCPTEGLERLSPARMAEDGYFIQWKDEFNLMRFDEQ